LPGVLATAELLQSVDSTALDMFDEAF